TCGEHQPGRAGKAHGRETRSVVAGADREDQIGMGNEDGVNDPVDLGTTLDFVPDAETHVEDEGYPPPLGESNGVIHRPQHAAGDGDPALRVVSDLEAEQL